MTGGFHAQRSEVLKDDEQLGDEGIPKEDESARGMIVAPATFATTLPPEGAPAPRNAAGGRREDASSTATAALNMMKSTPPEASAGSGTAAATVIRVGRTRCRDAAGYVGTIYFDGTIPTATSATTSKISKSDKKPIKHKHYYGVVWDDATRGRHDGSAVDPTTGQLVRYMRVPASEHEHGSHPTASSFVVPTKVDVGRPLSHSLLLERYVRKHRSTDWEQHVVMCAGGGDKDDLNHPRKTKPIELVGMDKIVSQQQVETLSTVSMRFMGINHIPDVIFSATDDDDGHGHDTQVEAGPSQVLLNERLKRCTHVDVAGNLLTDWNDLRRLLIVLPDLQNVSVAHNRFVDSTLHLSSNYLWSDRLFRLNVSKCNLKTSRTLVELCRTLPALESLCCAHADLGDLEGVASDLSSSNEISGSATGFANVQELDVTSCQLTTALLRPLSSLFPGVSTLNLTHNAIESWPDKPVFARLTHLQWSLTPPQRESLEASYHSDLMQSFTHLVEAYHDQLISLRIDLSQSSPTSLSSMSSLVGATPPSVVPVPCKLLLIACLGKLQLWNASHISDQERKDAEMYLLRHVDRDGYPIRPSGAARNLESSTPRLLIKCPRYEELVARHPHALQQAATGGGEGTNGALMNLVTVEFRSLCPHSCDRPPVIRKLPVTLTLGRLKSMLARHFDLDADLQELSWVVASSDATTKSAGRRDQTLPTPLNEHDDSTLEQCGLVHGAIVFMNEREISPREKENHHRAMLERKIQQQEHELAEFERRKRALAGGAV